MPFVYQRSLLANIVYYFSSIFHTLVEGSIPFTNYKSMPLQLHVEGSHGRFCLCSDCLLYAAGHSLWGIKLAIHILGKHSRQLVVFGAAVGNRLL